MHSSLTRRVAILSILLGLPVITLTAAPWGSLWARQGDGSTIITVDFRALTRDGTPVLDLKAGDIVLKVGGRARELVALELMQAGSGQSAGPRAPVPLPAPFVTNSPTGGGREVMLVVDDEAMAPGRETPVRNALSQLVSALSPADRVGLLPVKGGAGSASPTTRPDRVLAAIATLSGRATRGETPTDMACRSRSNYDALLGVFESVAVTVPTAVVFVSNGFTPPTVIEDIARGSGPASPCEMTRGDLEILARTVVASRAHFFVLQVIDDTTSGAPSGTSMSGGLEHLAGTGGNAVIRLIGESDRAIKRIASETSAYYLAAFEVSAQERNGAAERVEVSVTRPGVDIRVRPTLVIPKAGARPAKVEPPKPRDMLAQARVFRTLALRATAYTSRASGDGKPKVVVLFEPVDPGVRFTEAAVALFDGTGKARAQWTGQAGELRAAPVMAALNGPPPGTYRVRVAAIDASGSSGTVDQDIKVEAVKPGAVSVSELVLGVPAPNSFTPRLQFANEPEALALVEISGVSKTATVTANFELAASEDGPALATLAGTVPAPRGDLRMAIVRFPIGPMPPGDVVIRAVVSVDGQPIEAHPVRTLRKVER